jgi:RNA polymerase sigma factor (sigma-70 family)
MPHPSIPLVSQYLRRLRTRYRDPSPDHELLQRFVACRDEAAFAVLVERHAAMVLGLCRSILGNHHDAEDIFQAVFLVLARKAGSIRKSEAVGSWLYAVAYRLAHKARTRAGKRRVYEQQAAMPVEQTPMDNVTWGELRDVLHEEVSRLPEKYRAAVVLCYWEGRTHEQAGQQLGCARSTIKDRLERAREMLRTRLARRGLALPAAWFAASLSEGMSSAAVSAVLVQATVRGALLFSMGQLPMGVVSANVVACAKSALQAMLLSKLKLGLALVLMLGALGGGARLAMLRESAAPEAPAEQSKAVQSPKQERELVDDHGDLLPTGAVARLGTVRFRHADPVEAIALGPDGKSVVSAAGRTVYVWDVATGKEQRRFEGIDPFLVSVAVSPNGKLLAAGCRDGNIILWDMAANREVRRTEAHPKPDPNYQGPIGALRLQFTPDGKRLASVGADNALRLWDTATGKAVPGIGGHFHSIGRFALSPDGRTLAGIIEENETWEVRQWDIATSREGKPLARTTTGRIVEVAFSPNGKLLAVGVGEKNWNKPCPIQLWDVAAAKEVRTLRGVKGWASFAFSPDGKSLITTGVADETVRVWDVNTGVELRRLRAVPSMSIYGFLLCADGKTLVSGSGSGHGLYVWSLASGKEVLSSGDSFHPVIRVSYSPDGRLMAAGSYDGVIRLWDVAAKKEVRRFQGDTGYLTSVLFSPDGRKLASAGLHEIRIWDAASGKTLRRFRGTKDRYAVVCSLVWSGDGKMLAGWLREQRRICLWDAATGAELRRLDCGDTSINGLAFSLDSKTLAAVGGTWGRGNSLLLWETATGRLLRSFTPKHTLHCVVFSPDGRTLAAAGRRSDLAGDSREEREITLWEVVSGLQRLTLKHGEGVTDLAFSPDGRLLAAACNKTYTYTHIRGNGVVDAVERGKPKRQRVRLWDVAAEKELPPLEGHLGAIASLAFSPDGKLLATGSNDTTVLLWDASRFKPHRPAEVRLRTEQMESLWADLAGADAVRAYRAIRTLAAAPKPSVAFLQKHLRPVEPADAKQVAHLLADLDSDEFAVRDKAMQQLEKLGESAATELRKALAGKPSLEVKRRIEQLLEKQNGAEHIRMVRALEALEYIGTAEARELCAALADGVPDAPLTREARVTLRRMPR